MSDWIEWKGGSCPVAPDFSVDVKHRDGEISSGMAANFWDMRNSWWRRDPEGDRGVDIVAYRPAVDEAEEEDSTSDMGNIREFAKAVLHGDDEHRGWLLEAAECFLAGRDLPAARGRGAA